MDALKLLSRSTGLKTKDGIGSRVPSEGSRPIRGLPLKLQPGSSVADTDSVVSSNLGKRKRDTDQSPTNLTEGECRGVLKHYKIKISDLRALQNSKSKGTKKEQKELARIFPQPMTSFDELRTRYGVHHAVAENVADHGYRVPTEVQLASIPLLLQSADGPDLLTIAPTGSGKTLAFLIPLVQGIVQMHRETAQRTSDRRTSALILAPTKELVAQIVNEGRKLSARTGVSITAVRKGMRVGGEDQMIVEDGESSQSGEEQKSSGTGTKYDVKSDILVSTPLSLVNAISAVEATHRPLLPHIKSLVLDEADVLLDPLFREQTLSIWKACTNPALQATMWSATIGSNIEELVMKTIKQRQIDLSIRSERSILRCVVGLKDSAVSTIEHKLIYAATEPGKLLGLRQLLHPPSRHDGDKTEQSLRPPFLVFTQTIERATALYSELLYDIPAAAGGPERVAVLHSELSDTKRSDVMARFRKGQIWVLITTDLLSRGVDFRGVNGVVNYDIPTTTAAYVHRAGRTGRAGREGGVAVTFYTKDDINYVKGIANVIAASEKAKGNTGPGSAGIEKWVLDALPDISKNDRKELKHRGVEWRRGVRGNDDEKAAKAKRKARIGTRSGYEIQKEKNRRGAIEATRRQQEPDRNDDDDDDDSVWSGF